MFCFCVPWCLRGRKPPIGQSNNQRQMSFGGWSAHQHKLRTALTAGHIRDLQVLLNRLPPQPKEKRTLVQWLSAALSIPRIQSSVPQLDYIYEDDHGAQPIMYLAAGKLLRHSSIIPAADPTLRDSPSASLLAYGSSWERRCEARAAALRWLLSEGFEPDFSIVNHRCEGVLHCCLLNGGSLEVLAILLLGLPPAYPQAKRPVLQLEDARGDTALDVALKAGNWVAAGLLIKAGALEGSAQRQRSLQEMGGLMEMPVPSPGAAQQSLLAPLLGRALKKLPFGIGSLISYWVPGEESSKIEQEVAQMMAKSGAGDAGLKVSGQEASTSSSGAVAMDLQAVAAVMQKSVARVSYVLQLDPATAASLLAAHNYDVDATIEQHIDQNLGQEGARPFAPASSKAPMASSGQNMASSGVSRLPGHPQAGADVGSVPVNGEAKGLASTSRGAAVAQQEGQQQPVAAAREQNECLICFEQGSSQDFSVSLPCGHVACNTCWQGMLRARLNEGDPHRCHCPQPGCQVLLPAQAARVVLAPQEYVRYQQLVAQHYVDIHPHTTWCPKPGCGQSIQVKAGSILGDPERLQAALRSGRGFTVACSCGQRFCWECAGAPHEPASCRQMEQWRVISAHTAQLAEHSSTSWISSHTKQCPKCGARIEKDGGCNHMKCRSCCQEFCWICGGDWALHSRETGGFYQCNRYTAPTGAAAGPSSDAPAPSPFTPVSELLASLKSMAVQYKLQHYMQRYNAHECDSARVAAVLGRMEWACELVRAGMEVKLEGLNPAWDVGSRLSHGPTEGQAGTAVEGDSSGATGAVDGAGGDGADQVQAKRARTGSGGLRDLLEDVNGHPNTGGGLPAGGWGGGTASDGMGAGGVDAGVGGSGGGGGGAAAAVHRTSVHWYVEQELAGVSGRRADAVGPATSSPTGAAAGAAGAGAAGDAGAARLPGFTASAADPVTSAGTTDTNTNGGPHHLAPAALETEAEAGPAGAYVDAGAGAGVGAASWLVLPADWWWRQWLEAVVVSQEVLHHSYVLGFFIADAGSKRYLEHLQSKLTAVVEQLMVPLDRLPHAATIPLHPGTGVADAAPTGGTHSSRQALGGQRPSSQVATLAGGILDRVRSTVHPAGSAAAGHTGGAGSAAGTATCWRWYWRGQPPAPATSGSSLPGSSSGSRPAATASPSQKLTQALSGLAVVASAGPQEQYHGAHAREQLYFTLSLLAVQEHNLNALITEARRYRECILRGARSGIFVRYSQPPSAGPAAAATDPLVAAGDHVLGVSALVEAGFGAAKAMVGQRMARLWQALTPPPAHL